MAPQKELDILLRFLVDAKSDHELADAADKITSHFEKVEKQIAAVKKQATELRRTAADLGQVSRELSVLGAALAGGIFAAGAKYVKDAEHATRLTIEWKRAQDQLNSAGERFGAVAATTALPLLKQAAKLAEETAGFVEQHPDLVKIALNTGLVVATIGAVGTLVSKGIKFYADVQLIGAMLAEKQAAKQQAEAGAAMLAAANKQLEAAGLMTQKGTPSLLSAGPLAAILAGAAGAAAIGRGAANFGAKQFGFESPEDFWQKMLEKLGLVKKAADSTADSLGDAGDVLSAANSPQFDQILKAYEDYKSDDLALVRKHYEERQGIVADALASEQAENKQYAASVAKVNTSTAKSLIKAASDYNAANIKAEEDYNQNRAKIITDGARDAAKIQEKLQEQLNKLAKEHGERAADLTASRDALGLAKENRRYRSDVSDAKRAASQEKKDLQRSIAERLADLAASYEQERAQRAAEYAARVAEIKAQAAERLKELAAQHAEELKKIREQKAAKLRELDQQFTDERKRRYQQFIQQIKDLDASLLGETKLRQAYQAKMLQDLDVFLSAYRAGLGSLGGTSTSTTGGTSSTPAPPSSTFAGLFGFAKGGYASGTVKTGEQGIEYILTNQTVRAAERIIGGKLTQDGLLAALANSGGNRSVTVNANGRFSGEYTQSMRRAVQKDVKSSVQAALGLS